LVILFVFIVILFYCYFRSKVNAEMKMTFSSKVAENFLQDGSGIFLPTLFADFLTLVILTCFVLMIYKPIRNMVEFQKMAKQIGGPKSHWFWGDVTTVSADLLFVYSSYLML